MAKLARKAGVFGKTAATVPLVTISTAYGQQVGFSRKVMLESIACSQDGVLPSISTNTQQTVCPPPSLSLIHI